MTDIEMKALALLTEVRREASKMLGFDGPSYQNLTRWADCIEALCRAIEQHEAFRQEVSDEIVRLGCWPDTINLQRFIIAKPDPLAEAWIEATGNTVGMEPLNEALAKRGGKIVWEDE